MPYKAVDAVIDALSRYMQRLADQGVSVVMPRDVWALARLFPVLRGVAGIAAVSEETIADPQVLRQRAFFALRDVLAQIARRHPLVVFIDDVQWGDSDSAALLLELMRPPFAPAASARDDLPRRGRGVEPVSPRDRARSGRPAPTCASIPSDRSQPDEARRLALALARPRDAGRRSVADAVARESGGSPFLVEELARGAGSGSWLGAASDPGAPAPPLTLEQIIRGRLERLTLDAPQARRGHRGGRAPAPRVDRS